MKTESTPKTKKKKTFLWLLFFLLLFTAANIVLYLSRNEIDMFVPSTYKTLYHPTDVPTLSGTRVVRRAHLMLKIAMREQPVRWAITDDTGERYEQNGKFPVLKLKELVHRYELEPQGLKKPAPISIQFGYYTSELYKKGGRTQPDNYWLVSASIPMGKFHQYPLSHWVDTFPYVSEREKAEGRRILREKMGVTGAEGTLEKIDKICAYQAVLYKTQAGTPDDRMTVEVSPLKIFCRFDAREGKGWCTQMAIIYHFFANLAGVPTRLITLNGHIDTVITTGHSFAESFIPERNCWARVDPSGNKFYVWNKENRLLNSADILHAVIIGSYSDLSVKTFKEGHVVTASYSEENKSDIQLFSPGAQLIYRSNGYRHADKTINRYLFSPNLAYSLDAEYANRVYLCRRLLFGIWAALLIACLISLAYYLHNRK